jgi:hypothetical protein
MSALSFSSTMDGRRGVASPLEKSQQMMLEALVRTVEIVLQARVAPHELPRRAARTRFSLDVDEVPLARALTEPLWRESPHRALRLTVAWHHGSAADAADGTSENSEEFEPPPMALLERWDVHYVAKSGNGGGGCGAGDGGGDSSGSLGSSWTTPDEIVYGAAPAPARARCSPRIAFCAPTGISPVYDRYTTVI